LFWLYITLYPLIYKTNNKKNEEKGPTYKKELFKGARLSQNGVSYSAIEEAKAQDHPNLKEIAEKYQVSRKTLSDRLSGKIEIKAELGKNLIKC